MIKTTPSDLRLQTSDLRLQTSDFILVEDFVYYLPELQIISCEATS